MTRPTGEVCCRGEAGVTLLLSRADLEALLDLDDVTAAVERAFAAYSSGRADTPLRGAVHPPGTDGVLLSMPCALDGGSPEKARAFAAWAQAETGIEAHPAAHTNTSGADVLAV